MSSPASVTLYHPARGYGYLKLAGTHETFRFNRDDWRGDRLPQVGQLVEFTLVENRQGYLATDVTPAKIT